MKTIVRLGNLYPFVWKRGNYYMARVNAELRVGGDQFKKGRIKIRRNEEVFFVPVFIERGIASKEEAEKLINEYLEEVRNDMQGLLNDILDLLRSGAKLVELRSEAPFRTRLQAMRDIPADNNKFNGWYTRKYFLIPEIHGDLNQFLKDTLGINLKDVETEEDKQNKNKIIVYIKKPQNISSDVLAEAQRVANELITENPDF